VLNEGGYCNFEKLAPKIGCMIGKECQIYHLGENLVKIRPISSEITGLIRAWQSLVSSHNMIFCCFRCDMASKNHVLNC